MFDIEPNKRMTKTPTIPRPHEQVKFRIANCQAERKVVVGATRVIISAVFASDLGQHRVQTSTLFGEKLEIRDGQLTYQ